MVAPLRVPMTPRSLLLRVYSVKQDRGGPETHDPTPPIWEVRADSSGPEWASLFYRETNPHDLPPVDSLIHVTIDDQLTE